MKMQGDPLAAARHR